MGNGVYFKKNMKKCSHCDNYEPKTDSCNPKKTKYYSARQLNGQKYFTIKMIERNKKNDK